MTYEERRDAAQGWSEAGLTPPNLRENSTEYELGWTRGSLLRLLARLRKGVFCEATIQRVDTWEASLPQVDDSY